MSRHVALLRGINVGRANRVRMEELREVVAGLGYTEVRTLLNSGNVVFTAARPPGTKAAARLEEGLRARTGVSAPVTLLSAAELEVALGECPLLPVATDLARLLVAVPSCREDIERLQVLASDDWAPEALALGGRVAYIWCPDGVRTSRVVKAVGRELGGAVTARNWTTMQKVAAACGLDGDA